MSTTPTDGYEGVTHAGIAVIRRDGGLLVFLAQRSMDPTDDPEVQESWEFPGGSLNEGEDPWAGAVREFEEEIGFPLPPGEVIDGWRSTNGVYQGFVYEPVEFPALADWTPTDEVQAVAWVDPIQLSTMHPDINIRPELRDWEYDYEKLRRGDTMTEQAPENVAAATQVGTADEYLQVDDNGDELARVTTMVEQEPILDPLDLAATAIPIHGVLAPEDTESGDSRGFNAGAMTRRDYRLPFMWQKAQTQGHNNSVVTGSVDRMMRKDSLIHWEGQLMPSAEADEFVGLLAFFGRFPVSVDGDSGHLDTAKTEATGVVWFDAVRASGLTAVSVSAFPEAYVALGPHPDMPQDGALTASMVEAGDMVTFKRGPGWVTNPDDTRRIHDYWMPGHPGGAKIAWGTDGDFTRCTRLVGEKIAKNSPEKAGYIKQVCAQWHHDALGYWPGDLGKPGNAPDTPENRRRAATHASSEDEVSGNEETEVNLFADYQQAVEATDDIEVRGGPAEGEGAWEAVLVSSAGGTRTLPPPSYFDRHPDTGALVIEDADEDGFHRTHGYAAEWGVCHIGYDGRCVEVPVDEDGEFSSFHLGYTRTTEGIINTGVITYKVDHRAGQRILTETAEQQHFDNVAHAWAAVRLGMDDRGVWFSGVVLPSVPEEDLTLIEATGQVSGEWKFNALRALQAVNVPGFPVMRASATYDDEGNVEVLVASTFGATSDCAPTPQEMMAALARADAEARMEALRASMKGED